MTVTDDARCNWDAILVYYCNEKAVGLNWLCYVMFVRFWSIMVRNSSQGGERISA